MSASPLVSLRRAFSQPGFAVAVAVLLVAAVGLNAATEAMQLYFKKEAVPLRVKLDDEKGVPSRLGKWVQVSHDEPLDPVTLHTLGTDQFIFRDYVDSTIVPDSELAEFKDQPNPRRMQLLSVIEKDHPEAVVRVAVVYYTGLVDTVAHIPDHCMVADGFQPSGDPRIINRKFAIAPGGPERDVNLRSINFEDQSGTGRVQRNVAYFFHVNGVYVDSPLAVRGRLQNLFERYGYYAKVELTMTLSDQQHAENIMTDLLGEALPQVERCLPDWQEVKSRKK